MDDRDAIMIAEGQKVVFTKKEWIAAWQHLIDTGLCWTLQGWFGRRAADLIESGECQPSKGGHSE